MLGRFFSYHISLWRWLFWLLFSRLFLCLQDLGKEQKEEDILITLEDFPDVTMYYFFANLPALIVRTPVNQLHPLFDHITV